MRLTQGTFSFLPALSDDQVKAQVQYVLDHGWPVSIEHTDDPHPRNTYWEMYGLPMFEIKDAAAILQSIQAARRDFPNDYIKVDAYDARLGRQTIALSFLVHRPQEEPGFRVERTVRADRQIGYKLHAYASDKPSGERYRKS